MHSFYKKVALACLVSLTANQVAQAFEFSDILDWIKGNRTASVAIVGTLAAVIAFYVVSNKTTTFSPVQLYVSSDHFDCLEQGQAVEGVAYTDIKKANAYSLSAGDQRFLDDLRATAPVYYRVSTCEDQNYFLKVIRDPAKEYAIVGCLAYQKPRLSRNLIDIKALGVDQTYQSKDRIKMMRTLLNPLLDTTFDLKAPDNNTHAFIESFLKERGDTRSYDSWEERESRLFDRRHLRPGEPPMELKPWDRGFAEQQARLRGEQPAREVRDHGDREFFV